MTTKQLVFHIPKSTNLPTPITTWQMQTRPVFPKAAQIFLKKPPVWPGISKDDAAWLRSLHWLVGEQPSVKVGPNVRGEAPAESFLSSLPLDFTERAVGNYRSPANEREAVLVAPWSLDEYECKGTISKGFPSIDFSSFEERFLSVFSDGKIPSPHRRRTKSSRRQKFRLYRGKK